MRVRTVILLCNLFIVVLPLTGLSLLRVYDNQLVRQTETELLAQGAFVDAAVSSLLDVHTAVAAHAEPALDLWHDTVQPQAAPGPPSTSAPDPAFVTIAQALGQVLRDASAVTLAGVRVVDRNGTVVASSSGELGASFSDRPEVARALAGQTASLVRRRFSDSPAPALSSVSRSTGVRVFVAVPLRAGGAVVLSRTPMTLGKAVYQDRLQLAATALVLLVVVILFSFVAALLIVAPLEALARQARLATVHPNEPLRVTARWSTREVASLSQSLAQLSESLVTRLHAMRDFALHVSHEFKTPLTAIRGAAELLRDHEMSPDERRTFANNIDTDAERLQRLVHRLLELARAEQPPPVGAICDAEAVVRAVAAHTHAQLGPIAPAFACIDADILESVLVSLLGNAATHGGAAAIACAREGESVVVRVSDEGPGVSEANAARIFDPFFTTGRDRGSTGLGLTIARAVLMAHGGSLHLERPACFVVMVPFCAPSSAGGR